MNLRDLTNEYLLLKQTLDSLFSEDDDQDVNLQPLFDSIDLEFSSKVLSYANYLNQLKAESDLLKNREKSIYDRRSAINKKIEKIEQYIIFNMEAKGEQKIKGLDYIVSLSKNPGSLSITNENKIPDEYISYETVKSINKKKLKEDLNDGLYIDGAEIIKSVSLRIK